MRAAAHALADVAAVPHSLGTNVLKLAFGRRAKELEEKRAAAVASGAPPPKLPPLYTSRIWLVRLRCGTASPVARAAHTTAKC